MAKKGLTKETVIQTALSQIRSLGLPAFSLRTLAAALGIQVSSLYNHIESYNELIITVGHLAADMLAEQEARAIEGLSKDEALIALSKCYHNFATRERELYRIITGVHMPDLNIPSRVSQTIAQPMLRVMACYGLDLDTQLHFQRMLRSVLHGFLAHEVTAGFPSEAVDMDDSYRFAIECIAARLHEIGSGEK